MKRNRNEIGKNTSCLPKKEQGPTVTAGVQCGSKFPRALIIWNLKFENRRAGKKEMTKRRRRGAKQGER